MKRTLVIAAILLLLTSHLYAAQEEPGPKTIGFYAELPREMQIFYVAGAFQVFDLFVVDCSGVMTAGIIHAALEAKIAHNEVEPTDHVTVEIAKLMHELGCQYQKHIKTLFRDVLGSAP